MHRLRPTQSAAHSNDSIKVWELYSAKILSELASGPTLSRTCDHPKKLTSFCTQLEAQKFGCVKRVKQCAKWWGITSGLSVLKTKHNSCQTLE